MLLLHACLIFSSLLVTESFDTCSKRRHLQRLEGNSSLPGYYEVQCQADDEEKYESTQCWPSTGRCWCVDEYGQTIPESHVNPGQPIDCQTTGWCSSMKKRMMLELNGQAPPLGAPQPQCDSSGNFARSQSWGSTGQRWCAVANGNVIPGTTTGPGEPALDCDNLPVCLEKEASLAHLAVDNFYPIGLDRPECTPDGTFERLQCSGSSGYCWCVEPSTGVEIEGTAKGPGEGPLECDLLSEKEEFDEETATPCQRLKNAQNVHLKQLEYPIAGFWMVKCEEDGSFASSQCHPSTGHCWCVDEDGSEVPGSRAGPGEPRTPCLKSAPSCAKERKMLQERNDAFNFIGMFLPECNDQGNYEPKQCWGSTGQCWCVTPAGKEIAYTRRGPRESPGDLDCTGTQAPPKTMLSTGRLNDDASDNSSSSSASNNSSIFIAVIAVLAILLALVSVGSLIYIKRNTGAPAYTDVNAEL